MRVVVWSERNEPHGDHRWRDCAYCAVLMLLTFGGFTRYPLGIYTVAEREALERADSRPDETGANPDNIDEAVRKRYAGLVLPRLTEPLSTALTRVGTALKVDGVNARLPAHLRRWDPVFSGGHSATVIVVPAGQVRWLDPEAPMLYEGDVVPISIVTAFVGGNAGAVRVVKADQFAPKVPAHTMHAAPGVYTTYRVLADRRAQAIGILPTRGFPAQYELVTARQNDGTGATTLLRVLSGGYKGKLLYRYAPGISLLS